MSIYDMLYVISVFKNHL